MHKKMSEKRWERLVRAQARKEQERLMAQAEARKLSKISGVRLWQHTDLEGW